MLKKILFCLFAISFSINVFATEIIFPPGKPTGDFNCTASDPNATANITMHLATGDGFCEGQPYIAQDGQVVGMPVSILNQYAFKIKKHHLQKSSVTVNVSHGSVHCDNNSGDKPLVWGNGSYCSVQ